MFYRVQIHSPSACDFKPDKKIDARLLNVY